MARSGMAQSVARTHLAVMPKPATGQPGFGGREPRDGIRPCVRVAQDGMGQPRESGQGFAHPGSVHPPRVHGGHRQIGPPVLERLEQFHLSPLAARISLGRPIGLLAVGEIIDTQALRVHAARGHQHDPASAEATPQQFRQQRRSEHVDGHRLLEPLRCQGVPRRHHPCVVHEPREIDSLLVQLFRTRGDRVEIGQIAHPYGACAWQSSGDRGRLVRIAHDEMDVGT
ncbi:hypothetical protein GCM10028781_35430 [Nostocoides australiense]